MAQANQIILKFVIDIGNSKDVLKSFDSGIRNVANDFDKIKQPANALETTFGHIATRYAGVAAMVSAVRQTLGAFITASNEAEAAGTALAQALKQQGNYSERTMLDLNAYARSLQETTGIDDDLTVRIMAQLTAMNLQGDSLKRATALAQDLSVVMGTDASSAARVMADAFNGNVGMLGRYIKGLDEADIKQRGAISIIEQLERAVGGQAEAFGNTGAGAIKKFDASLSDFKESAGDLIKNVLGPILAPLSEFLRSVNELPPALHGVVMGVTALAAVFIMFNTRLGATPYIVSGVVVAILEFVKAVKEGDVGSAILIATLSVLAVTVLVLGRNIFTLVTGIRDLVPALQLMNQTLIANPWIAVAAAVAALALALYAFYRGAEARQEEFEKAFTSSMRRMVDASLDELGKLDKKSLKIRLDWEIGSAENQIAALKKQISEAETDPRKSEDEIKQLQQRLQYLEATLRGFREMQADNERQQKEVANSAKISAEIEKQKVQAMTEGTAKRKAMARAEHTEELVRLKERLDKGEITQRQHDEFVSMSATTLSTKLIAIDAKLRVDRENVKMESARAAAELNRDEVTAQIDLDEKLAISRSRSEKEKLQITLDHAILRVQAEFDANLKILNMEADVLNNRLKTRGLSDDERETIRRRLIEIESERNKIASEAERKTKLAKIEFQVGVTGLPEPGSIKAQEEEIARIQKDLAEATTETKRKELRKQLADAESVYDRMTKSVKELKEEEIRIWKEAHEFEMGLISSMLAGFRTLWDEIARGQDNQRRANETDYKLYILDSEDRKKELRSRLTEGKITHERYSLELQRMDIEKSEREKALTEARRTMWEKSWISMRDTAMKSITELLLKELESLIITTAAHKTAETQKTVSTQTGVASRIVSLAGEIIKTLASAAASMVKAVASVIEWQVAAFGPFAIATIPASVAAMVGIYSGIKKALGFDQGGRIKKGERGFFEGNQDEVVAPEKTFLEIARTEWLPKLVMMVQQINLNRTIENISRDISTRTERSTFVSTDPVVKEMRNELRELKNIMRKKELSLTLNNLMDGQTFLEENLSRAQHRKEYYSK